MALPTALAQNPRLGDWVVFDSDRITIVTGKVELGQGIRTALAIIAAEELDVPVANVTVRSGSTSTGPNEFITAGSMSIEGSGAAIRQACAEVRAYLLELAAERFGANAAALIIEDGVIRNPQTNEALRYHEITDGKPIDQTATGTATPKHYSRYSQVGRSATRIDLAAKISGGRAFVQDLRPGNLCHGRIVRPPSDSYRLASIDTSAARNLPGVIEVIVDGSFVGVVAEREFTAVTARELLARSARWTVAATSRLPGNVHEYLIANPDESLWVVDGTPTLEAPPPRESGNHTVRAVYRKPYHMHGSIGPSAALASFDGTTLHIRTHSQGPYIIRGAIAVALGMAEEQIVVEHAENAGCYGHNGADDAAMDAALLAIQLPGRDVLLKWQREDEHAWEPYSPAMAIALEGSIDTGRVSHWNADIYSQTHSGRPMPHRKVSNLVAAWHRATPMPRAEARPGMGNHSGIHRNADPIYDFPKRRIMKHLVKDQRVRTSSTRGLGAFGNVFAIESFMDELALAAGADPVAFRLAQLADPRARAVVTRSVELGRAWQQEAMPPGWRQGKGLAFARYKNRQTYAAVTVFLAINEETFEIRLQHASIAADAGQVIDSDGLANQLEGGLIQAASWTLKEAVGFDEFATNTLNWQDYPILRFTEIPTVDVALIDHPELPSLGAGEATQGPTPAAIANAIYDAVGIRLREMPFTPDRLRTAALKDDDTADQPFINQ